MVIRPLPNVFTLITGITSAMRYIIEEKMETKQSISSDIDYNTVMIYYYINQSCYYSLRTL